MQSIFEARRNLLRDAVPGFDAVLLYGSRGDSRYSTWLSGASCRSTHHYVLLAKGDFSFIEVSYRAAELRAKTDILVTEVAEEDMFKEHFARIFSPEMNIALSGNAPAAHFIGRDLRLTDVTTRIDQLMFSKSAHEVDAISSAARAADTAVEECWKRLRVRPETSESDLAREILRNLITQCDQLAFPLSVVSGERLRKSTVGAATSVRIDPSLPCLIDFGIVKNGLHVDLTRMFFVNDSPLSAAYNRLKEALHQAIKHIKPGVTIGQFIAELRDALLERELPAETLEVPDLGHGIGFALHEYPIIGREECNSLMFEEGMILCLEPEIIVNGFRLRHEEMVAVFNTAKCIAL